VKQKKGKREPAQGFVARSIKRQETLWQTGRWLMTIGFVAGAGLTVYGMFFDIDLDGGWELFGIPLTPFIIGFLSAVGLLGLGLALIVLSKAEEFFRLVNIASRSLDDAPIEKRKPGDGGKHKRDDH
jgi:hypothetical protein